MGRGVWRCRLGKTTALVWWLLKRLQQFPKHNAFAIGADYEQLRRGFFQSLSDFLTQSLGWEEGVHFRYRDSPSPMMTLLPSGARIRSLSAELAERIASTQLQTVVLEEPQTWHNGEKVFQHIVERLRHTLLTAALYPRMVVQGRMSFNPPARGHWLQKLLEEKWPKLGYPSWRFSLRDNVLLTGLDRYIANIENTTSPDRWANRIDGHWATSGGSVYRMFDRERHGMVPAGLPPFGFDESRPILWTHDFNVALMCSVVAQDYQQPLTLVGDQAVPAVAGWQPKIVRVLGEICLEDAGTPDVVDAFMERYGDIAKKTGVELYGDTSGGARSQTAASQSAARTNWSVIRNGLMERGVPVKMRVPTHNPSVKDRINEMNAQLRAGNGFGMVIDLDACPRLVADLTQVSWSDNGQDLEKRKNPELTHVSDALGYLVYDLRRPRTEWGFTVGKNSR